MNIQQLANLLISQASNPPGSPSNTIQLSDTTLQRTGVSALITQYLRRDDGILYLSVDYTKIPTNPPASGFTLSANVPTQSGKDFLNLVGRNVSINFVPVGNDVGFTLDINLTQAGSSTVKWVFSDSFSDLQGMPFDDLDISAPHFVFATDTIGSYSPGLYFYSSLVLTGFFADVATLISGSDTLLTDGSNDALLSDGSSDSDLITSGDTSLQMTGTLTPTTPGLDVLLECDLGVPTLSLGNVITLNKLFVGTSVSYFQPSNGTNGGGDTNGSDDTSGSDDTNGSDDNWQRLIQAYLRATVNLENSDGDSVPLDLRLILPVNGSFGNMTFVVLPGSQFATSISSLGTLVVGQDWSSLFGGASSSILPYLDTFGLKSATVNFSIKNFAVTSVIIDVGTLSDWTLWGDNTLALDVNWMILLGTTTTQNVTVSAFFQFSKISFDISLSIPDLIITGVEKGMISYSLSDLNQEVFGGALSIPDNLLAIDVEFGNFTTTIDIPSKSFYINAQASASFSLFGTQILAIKSCTVAVTVAAATSSYNYTANLNGILALGPIEAQVDATLSNQSDCVLTMHLIDETIGSMLNHIVHLVDPTFDISFPDPWNKLLDISLDAFVVEINITKGSVKLSYDASIDLIFIDINSISLLYQQAQNQQASSVQVQVSGTFLGQPFGTGDNPPLSWDAINEQPPAVPGKGSSIFDLEYVGLGQHIAFKGVELTTVEDVMKALRQSVVPSQAGQLPPFGQNSLAFSAQSNWLIGAQFTVMDTVAISAIFNDPNLYGILIALSGAKAQIFAGLSFEILYRKVTDTIGVYHIELKLPDAMRNLQFGEVSITLPIIVLDIYTNGNFRVDFGFPKGLDFSNSFSLQIFPFVGYGGFYFALLDGATSSRVPQITNGTFSPVVEFGVALSIGVGKTINEGILSGGISVTVVGILQGVLAWFNPTDVSPKETYYWFQGTISIVGKLYATINFAIIQASIDVTAYASVTLTIEAHQPIYIALSAGVSVRVSVKIIFFTIHLSFSATINASFTIGSATPTPWQVASGSSNSSEQPQLSGQKTLYAATPRYAGQFRVMRKARVMLALSAPPTDWPAVCVLPQGQQTVTVWALPAFTKSEMWAIEAGGAVRASGTTTLTTTTPHDLDVGDVVTISGVTDNSFNGTFQVATAPTNTTFTYNQSGQADSTSGNGNVTAGKTAEGADAILLLAAENSIAPNAATLAEHRMLFGDAPESATFNLLMQAMLGWGIYVENSGTGVAIAAQSASGAVRASGTATITTTSPHGFNAGDTVIVSGVSDNSFNGFFIVASVPSTTTFTYAQSGQSNSNSGGGMTGEATVTADQLEDLQQQLQNTDVVAAAFDYTTLTNLLAENFIFNVTPATDADSETGVAMFPMIPAIQLTDNAGTSITFSSFNEVDTNYQQMVEAYFQLLQVQFQSRNSGNGNNAQNEMSVEGQSVSMATLIFSQYFNMLMSSGVKAASDLLASYPYTTPTAMSIYDVGSAIGDSGLVSDPLRVVSPNQDKSVLSTDVFIPLPGVVYQILVNDTLAKIAASFQNQGAFNQSLQPYSINDLMTANLGTSGIFNPGASVQFNGLSYTTQTNDTLNLIMVRLQLRTIGTTAYSSINGLASAAQTLQQLNPTITNPNQQVAVSIAQQNTGAVRAGGTATITTISPHGLNAGDTINIQGVSDNSFNGQFKILSVPSTTTFTYAQSGEPNSSSGGGIAGLLTITLAVSIAQNAGAVRASGTTTLTTTTPHGFVLGDLVAVSGVSDNSFDGQFQVASVPSPMTFTYLQSGEPDSSSGGGSVISAAISSAQGAAYSVVAGDTLTLVAAYFLALTQSTINLSTYLASLLQLNPNLTVTDPTQPQPPNTLLTLPPLTLSLPAGATINQLATTLITTQTVIENNLEAVPETTALLAPQGVLNIPLQYKTALGDTFSGIASKFNLTLNDMADQSVKVEELFAASQSLTITDLASIGVQTLMNDLLNQTEWNNASGMVSRFLLSGLRLPDPNDTYFQSLTVQDLQDPTKLADIRTKPMFKLTGQQYPIATPSPSNYQITLTNIAGVSWLEFGASSSATFGLTTDQQGFLNTIASTAIAPGIQMLARLALFQMVPPRIALQNHIAWQATLPPAICSSSSQPATGNPVIWLFPDTLVLQLDQLSSPALYEIVVATHQDPNQPVTAKQADCYAWATIVDFTISLPVTDGSVSSVSNAYIINGADDVGASLLQQVYNNIAVGSSQIAANGAVRASGTTTITTTSAHDFNAGDTINIQGVSDNSFNGQFKILSVPSTTTFTFAQSGQSNSTSGGGKVTAVLATLYLLYSPNPTSANPSGLSSDQINADATYILKTNLSTLTHSGYDLAAMVAPPPDPTSVYAASLSDPADFVALLWEASVTRSGGFYLNYVNQNGGAGLPASVFGDSSTATLSLLVLLNSQAETIDSTIQPFNNCAIVGGNIDTTVSTLFVQPATYTVQPNDCLQSVQTNFNTDWATAFSLLDIATFNQSVSLLLQVGAPIAIPGQSVPYLVEYGDTMSSIVTKFNNKFDLSALISAGSNATSAILAPGAQMNIPGQNQPYTIEYGDTLLSLAATYTNNNVDTLLSAGNNMASAILVAGAPLAVPGQSALYTIASGDTLNGILQKFNLSNVDALLAAGSNATSAILTAGTQMQFADNVLQPSTTVPPGTVGFEMTRVNPDPDNLPFSDLSPQQKVNSLFNLVGFSIAESGVFTASGAGLPTTPADSAQAQSDGLTPSNVDDSNDPNWYYEQSLAVSPFGSPQYGSASAALPSAKNNPYNGVGYNSGANQINSVTIDLDLQDIYGNIQPLPAPYNSLQVPVGYYDDLVSFGSWPSLAISYMVSGSAPSIEFDMTMQQVRYIPSPSTTVDSALQAIAADLTSYTTIYYQLVQPDFSISLQTTLDANSMASQKSAYTLSTAPFFAFAYGAYIYLAALSTMKAVELTADGNTTSVLGVMNQYGVTATQLFETNQNQLYNALFGSTMLVVPQIYSTIAGDSLSSIATKASSTANNIATTNSNVPLNPGNDLWALPRTVPVTPPLSVITTSPGGAVRAGGTTTITTATPHGFVQGDLVAISGVSDSSFDGVFTVASAPTTTTLTFEQSGQPDSTSGGGTVSSPTASSIAASGAVRASGTTTITTTSSHGFNTGDIVVVSSVSDASFDGLFQVVSVPSDTSFTYQQLGLADSTSGVGTASLPTPSLNAVAQTAHASVTALAEANAARTDILQQGVVLAVGTQSYQLGENDSFNNAAQKLGATIGAVATANQWLQGLLVAGATLAVNDVLVAPNDTLAALAFNYAGGDLNTFATNNAAVQNLFPSATSVQVGLNSSPIPPEADDTLTTFAATNKVSVDQLANANASDTVMFAAGAKMEIPGVMTNTSTEQYCTYTAGQQDTLGGIAQKFGKQPADIAALNIDIPGLLAAGQTIKDTTSGQSVQTSSGDTFNSIIARFQSINVTVILSQLANDVAGQGSLVVQSSLWICPPMLGGANGFNSALSLDGLATAYNTDILTFATANAAAIGFLAPNVPLTLWGVSIQTNDYETLNSLVNRLSEKGVTINNSAVTVADVANAVATVQELISQTASVVPIPPPSPAANSTKINPNFSAPIFQITVNLISMRNPLWVDPDFVNVPAVSTSVYSVSPEPDQQSSGNSSLGLTQFATDLQESIQGLYVATGDPVAEDDPASASTIWGVNFGSSYGQQINYHFYGSNTQYFALPPLSTSLTGGSVNVIPYVSGQNPPFTGTVQQQTFQAVDLDVWLNTFLQAVDTFLSPAYAIPAYAIDPADGVSKVKAVVNVVQQKQTLAQAISQRLLYVLQGQSGGSQSDAVTAIQQAMLTELSSAFTVDTIMQVPVTVKSPFDSTEWASAPRLSGKVIMNDSGNALETSETEQPALPNAFSFSTAKVSLTNTAQDSTPTATFLFSVKAPAEYKEANLDLQYVVTELELPDPNSVIGSYEGSSWLKFILPLDSSNSNIGAVNIPIPLRSYPSPVTLVSQSAQQSVVQPESAADLLGWNFSFAYQHDDAEQDTPLVAVTFNAPQTSAQSGEAAPTDQLIEQVFSALAQFMAVYPVLQNDLAQLTQVAPGTTNATALAAAQAFSQLVTWVAEAWNVKMEAEAFVPQTVTYYYQMQKQQSEELNPTLTTLTITSFDLDTGQTTQNPTVLWPSVVVQFEGKQELLAPGTQTNTSAEYNYPPGIPADEQLTQYFIFGSSIAASPTGAVRASGTTTITTISPHGFNTGDTVVVSGVSDTSFDGLFQVVSVPSDTSFTYRQSGLADSTGGGGTAGNVPKQDTSTLTAPQFFSFTLNENNFNVLSQQNGRAGVSITRNLSLLSDSNVLTNTAFVYQTPLANFTSNAAPSIFADEPILVGSSPTGIAQALGTFLQTLLTSENNQWQEDDLLTMRFSAGYSYALATSTGNESTLPVLSALVPILLVPSFQFDPTLDWQWPGYNNQENPKSFVSQVQAAITYWQSNNSPSMNSGSYLFNLTIYASQGQLQPLIQVTSLQYNLTGS